MPNEDLETRILELLQNALQPIASQLVDAVRSEALAEAKRDLLRALSTSGLDGASPPVIAAPVLAAPKLRRNGAETKRHLPAHCVYPDCSKPHKGPRFSFMCDDHMGVGKRDKTKYLSEWKQTHSA
jgi:hypothetical protein